MQMIRLLTCTILIGTFLFSCDYLEKKSGARTLEAQSAGMGLNSMPDKVDDNLIRDLRTYMDSFYNGDADTAFEYVYPEYHTYIINEYPEEIYTEEVSKQMMRKVINSTNDTMEKLDMTMEIKINEITDKYKYRGDLIYTVSTSVVSKNYSQEHAFHGDVFGISSNSGASWTFIQKDEKTSPGILRINYPNSVINRVMR